MCFSESRLARNPCVVVFLRIDNDSAAHNEVAYSAEFFTQDVVAASDFWLEPEIGNKTWHHVHLHAELGNRVVMQHVVRAQQRFYWLADRQMHLRRVDDDVVHAVWIFWVDTERIEFAYELGVSCAELTVGAWIAEIPLPLLPHHFVFGCFFRHSHEVCPNEEARCEHRDNTYRGDRRQPAFELVIFWLVNRFMPWLLAEPVNAVGQEEVAQNKYRACYPERDTDYTIDAVPLRDYVGEPPWTREVKDYRSDNQRENNDR